MELWKDLLQNKAPTVTSLCGLSASGWKVWSRYQEEDWAGQYSTGKAWQIISLKLSPSDLSQNKGPTFTSLRILRAPLRRGDLDIENE